MNLSGMLNKENEFKYQMLDRLKSDCDYYLGNGNYCKKHLYFKNVKQHIKAMKKLYKSFLKNEKPEWITPKDIKKYKKLMTS